MNWAVRVNAILTLVLAVLFDYAFNFLKHDPVVSLIIPFENDPYDSVGSLAAIVALPLAILALFRVFHPLRDRMTDAMVKLRAARVQIAVVVAVLITVFADAVALIRHPARWSGASGSTQMIAILVGLGVMSASLGIVVRRTLNTSLPAVPAVAWRRLLVAASVSIVVLAMTPETIVGSVVGELIALATGIVLLFWLMSSWLVVVLPGNVFTMNEDQSPRRTRATWLLWVGVVTIGLCVGAYLLWLESREDGGIAPAKYLVVACSFLGAGAFGITSAVAFLRGPLGLFRSD